MLTDTLKHFGCELGAQTNFNKDTGTSIVNGAHDAKKLSEVLEIFIKKYVQCYSCGNPETVVKVRRECIFLKCKACGHTSDVDMRDKLTTFIVKNPPENKLSKAEAKVKKDEKDRMKAAEKEAKKAEKAETKEKDKTKKKKDKRCAAHELECRSGLGEVQYAFEPQPCCQAFLSKQARPCVYAPDLKLFFVLRIVRIAVYGSRMRHVDQAGGCGLQQGSQVSRSG